MKSLCNVEILGRKSQNELSLLSFPDSTEAHSDEMNDLMERVIQEEIETCSLKTMLSTVKECIHEIHR